MLRDLIFLQSKCKNLIFFYIDCFFTPFIFSDIKRNLVVLPDLVDQSTYVDKDVLICFVLNDKTKSFSLIEKFYFTR